MIFDGTTRSGEAMAIILRFVNDWAILQCLIQLQLLAKSLTGEVAARELISVLRVDYRISPGTLVGAKHDRASTNSVAMTTLRVLYPEMLGVSHIRSTMWVRGSVLLTLSEFVTAWISLFLIAQKPAFLGRHTLAGHQVQRGGGYTQMFS